MVDGADSHHDDSHVGVEDLEGVELEVERASPPLEVVPVVDETVTTAALKPHKHTTKTNKQQGERSMLPKGLVCILERGS